MNIVLIGLRGSGKSTIGNLLSEKLNMKFIDADIYLVNKSGKSIPVIVKEFGWDNFRDLEEKIIKEISQKKEIIIATGGGVVERQNNIINLKKSGKLVWLNAKVTTLVARVGNDPNRPPLTDSKSLEEEMKVMFNKRKRLYQKAADLIITTDNKSPKDLVQIIINNL